MKLILSVITCPAGCNMEGQHYEFGADGGNFGRAPDNQWILPDPSRYVSSRHGQISCENGQFILVDQSTNGIYLNGAVQPVEPGSRSLLNSGDQLQFGDYRLKVSIDATASVAPSPTSESLNFVAPPSTGDIASTVDDLDKWLEPSVPAAPQSQNIPPQISASPIPQSGLGLDLGLKEEEKDPLAALGGAGGDRSSGLSQAQPGALSDLIQETPPLDQQMMRVPNAIPDDWDDLLGGHPEPSAPLTGHTQAGNAPLSARDSEATTFRPIDHEEPSLPTQPKPIQPSMPSDAMGLEELLATPSGELTSEPAPISPQEAITPEVPTPQPQVKAPVHQNGMAGGNNLAELLGLTQISEEQKQKLDDYVAGTVKETVAGMMQTLRARSEIKSEFRMNMTTIQSAENNPLKFSVTVDDAIENMFAKTGKAYLSPIEAIKDGFADISDHQLALFEAMRAAYDHLLSQFDPNSLEQKYERTRGKGLLKSSGKGKNWDSFKATYEEYKQDNEATFKRLFGEVFSDSYERRMHSLKMNRNK